MYDKININKEKNMQTNQNQKTWLINDSLNNSQENMGQIYQISNQITGNDIEKIMIAALSDGNGRDSRNCGDGEDGGNSGNSGDSRNDEITQWATLAKTVPFTISDLSTWENQPPNISDAHYATQILLQGGCIYLRDATDEIAFYELTLHKLIQGINDYTNSCMNSYGNPLHNFNIISAVEEIEEVETSRSLDDIDSIKADMIFQYALFGTIKSKDLYRINLKHFRRTKQQVASYSLLKSSTYFRTIPK